MDQDRPVAVSRLTSQLSPALSLAERSSRLRQTATRCIATDAEAVRGAAALARWRSREQFEVGGLFERRLRIDGLTEEALQTILGAPPEAYAGLAASPPDWASDLEELYQVGPAADDVDPELSRLAQSGTNGFLWLASPLIREALRRFRERSARFPAAGAPFDAAAAERLTVPYLMATLKHALETAMVLELAVARVQGSLTGETPEERFRSFCDRLRDHGVRLSLVREYPVLFRSLHEKAMNWLENSLELLERLHRDWELIRARLAPAADPGRLTSITFGAGDAHRRGRTVAILGFSTGFRIVYKPHGQSVDVHFGELLRWINAAGFEAPFRVLEVIDCGRYGWSEFVAHATCGSRAEVERFYRRLGGYLAAFRLVRARDMHFENVIAVSEHPMAVDLETMFHNDAGAALRDDPAIAAFQSSVMQVLLLPQPVQGASEDEVVDMSGLGASSDQAFPLGRTAFWEREGTDEMRVGHTTAVPTMNARNRPQLDGREVDATEYFDAFLAGFRSVYRLIADGRDELAGPGGLLERFAEDEVRFVARPTAAYAVLLKPSHHPDRLRNAIDRDHALDALWLGVERQPHLIRLIPAEVRDLQGGDVPVFTSRPDSRDLWTSDGERIPEVFDQPAMALVREVLGRMGAEDLAQQERIIRTAIMPREEGASGRNDRPAVACPPATVSQQALGLARTVGDQLCRDVLENASCASWIGITPVGADGRSSIHPMEPGLYDGLSGCALFLAYLAAATGEASYRQVADKALTLVRRHLARTGTTGVQGTSVGAFTGVGGTIYTLTHLGVLWGDPSLLDAATALSAEVPPAIDADESLDVIGGSAGAIAVLHALNAVRPDADLLRAAIRCGDRLVQRQQRQATGAGWTTDVASSQPLTGFSHGAAGIAWALLKLADWSGAPRFREAAEAAIAYERSTFLAEQANWPDYRAHPGKDPSETRCELAWCHGAPGIGLARIDSLRYMDDPGVREEIRIALRTTVASGLGANHGLCHGALGNLEVMLHAARHVDGSWWSDFGERLAREALPRIAGRDIEGARDRLAPLGLMTGLAGIGYGLLRLADPERIPSMLVLEPPRTATRR